MPIKQRQIEIQPPLAGLQENYAYEVNPPFSSPQLLNVRPYDCNDVRARIGQRPGLVKAYSTQVGGAHPVLLMASITTTFIEAGT